ncbi:MAG: hypothetical protein R2795_14780 [Saprospiraceae bacterium]
MGTLYHPLANLNAAIFIHQDEPESRDFIARTTDSLLQKARKLHQRFVRMQSKYADQLATWQEAWYLQMRTQGQELAALLEDGKSTFGADTLASNDRTLRLYGIFSEKYRAASEQKQRIQEQWAQLGARFEARKPFEWEWQQAMRQEEMEQQLGVLKEKLEHWRNHLADAIQQEMVRLNHKTALPELEASATIEALEQDMDMFLDEVNASGLYQLPLQSNTLTLARQQRHLDEVTEQLERTRDGVNQQYAAFHAWQRNWFSMAEATRKTIQAIIRARPASWEHAFSTWYFHECLQKHYLPFPTMTRREMQEHSDNTKQLYASWPSALWHQWEPRQKAGFGALKPLLKHWPENVAVMAQVAQTALAAFKPITFCTPELAMGIAEAFDVVVLEHAQSMTPREIDYLANHKGRVVIGSDALQTGLMTANLIEHLAAKGFHTSYLSEEQNGSLVRNWQSRQSELRFLQVDGRMDADAMTNEVEVHELIRLLNTIEPNQSRTYPSVGILAWSWQQRDLILQNLYRIKKERGPGADLVQQLERNGLQVLYGADMAAQRFNVVIVSPVLGTMDANGHLPDMKALVNQPEALAKMDMMIQCLGAAGKVVVLNSIPEEELRVRLDWTDSPGERYLAWTLLSAKAIAEGNTELTQQITAFWQAPATEDESPRFEPLVKRLNGFLQGWQWQVRWIPAVGQSLLVAIAPNHTTIALLPDGFVSPDTHTTVAWEHLLQQRLQQAGYRVLPWSSEQMWKDPARTAHHLAAQLQGLASQEEE